jgi:chromate transporter
MVKPADSPPRITLLALFLAFLEIAVTGFGGALPWARHVLVDRRRWLTDREFAELLGLCQIVPGGNILNFAVLFGTRHCGNLGAIVAFTGLLMPPFVIISLLGLLYAEAGQLEWVRAGLRGVAAVAVGLVLSNSYKLGYHHRRNPWALGIIALAFVGVGVLRLSLVPVLLILAPFSIALAWRKLR